MLFTGYPWIPKRTSQIECGHGYFRIDDNWYHCIDKILSLKFYMYLSKFHTKYRIYTMKDVWLFAKWRFKSFSCLLACLFCFVIFVCLFVCFILIDLYIAFHSCWLISWCSNFVLLCAIANLMWWKYLEFHSITLLHSQDALYRLSLNSKEDQSNWMWAWMFSYRW